LSSTEGNPVPSHRSWRTTIRAAAAATALTLGATAFTLPPASAAASGWRTVPGPAVATGASANLTALALATPSLGWASGFTMANANAPFEPLLAAWNGRRWRTVPVGLGKIAGARLDGLAVASATDAWAVGEAQSATKPGLRPVIEHWNGRRWQLMVNPPVPPMTALNSVSVAADGEAWAVGTPFINTGRGVILHWTGHAWVTASAPKTGGSVLLDGVTAVSPGNVWAVGSASADGGPYLPYALRWNGRRWAVVAVPHPGEGNQSWGFESVTSIGHGDLVAVGSAGSATVGRALYGTWNGRGWSLSTGPHITQLNAVSFDGRNATWAVGSESTSGQAFRPVIQVHG
jgi:hypothetical protein